MLGIFFAGILAGLLQIWFIESPAEHIYSDILGYVSKAEKLAMGQTLSPLDTFFPLGTSYFFTPFYYCFGDAAPQIIGSVHVALIAASHVLLGLTCFELFRSGMVARLSSLLSLLYWPITAQSSFLMSEPAFLFCVIAGQYCFVRFMARPQSLLLVAAAGLLFGAATIMKSQGFVFVITAVLISIVWQQHRSRRLLWIPLFLACSLLPVFAQSLHFAQILGKDDLLILPSNGSYNMYNGQSARRGVGAYQNGVFHIFFNSNWYFNQKLSPPIVFNTTLSDKQFFNHELLKLWQEDPLRQVSRLGVSASELFVLSPQWPLRNVKTFAELEVLYKYLSLVFIYLPAMLAMWMVARYRADWAQVLFLVLPVAGVVAAAALTSGQPRYLIPFIPNIIAISALGWACLSKENWRGADHE